MVDFTCNSTGTSINPYNPTGVIKILSNIRTDASPNGFRPITTGVNAIFAHDVAYGSTITVTGTMASVHAFDDVVLGAVARSGGNAGCGIGVQFADTTCRVVTWNASGTVTGISTNTTITRAVNDVFSVTVSISGSTATITAKQNGSNLTFNANTTTTNTGETTLAAGVYMAPQGNNTTRLSQFTGTGIAGVAITGTGAVTSSIATASGTAAQGKGSVSANPTSVYPTVSGSGVKGVTGSGNITIGIPRVLASAGASITGSGAITSSKATTAGTAFRGVTDNPGDIALTTTNPATLAGTSIKGVPRTASGALTGPSSTLAGTAARGWGGTGVLTAPAATLDGSAFKARALTGTGALQTSAFIVNGTTVLGHAGTGALTAPKAALAGFIAGTGGGASLPGRAHSAAHRRAILFAHGRPVKWQR